MAVCTSTPLYTQKHLAIMNVNAMPPSIPRRRSISDFPAPDDHGNSIERGRARQISPLHRRPRHPRARSLSNPPGYSFVPHIGEVILDRGAVFNDDINRDEFIGIIFPGLDEWESLIAVTIPSVDGPIFAYSRYEVSPYSMPHITWDFFERLWRARFGSGVAVPDEIQINETAYSRQQFLDYTNNGSNGYTWSAYCNVVNPKQRTSIRQIFPHPSVTHEGVPRVFGRSQSEPGKRRRKLLLAWKTLVGSSRPEAEPPMMLISDRWLDVERYLSQGIYMDSHFSPIASVGT